MAYEEMRHLMVENQLKSRGIRDGRVLAAMESVHRHLFVDEIFQDRAYDDCALPIGEGQTISQPYMVALMTELLELKAEDRVLEIGTGSGYQTAILSLLASEVFTVERMETLAIRAERLVAGLGYTNIHVITGDGTLGLPGRLPFDGILVTAAAPKVPDTYIQQLEMDGRLVIPVGSRYSQVIYQIKKTPSGINTSLSTPCVFVPLVGKEGWKEMKFY